MVMNFKLIMFSWLMVTGTILSLCSNNWMSMWLGLEISMMSFLPLMSSKLKLSSESCIKYYIVQSLSSSIMMMGIIMMSLDLKSETILTLSLIMKLGMVPFHNWVLSIIEGMSYINMIFMFTIMKLSPMNMISFTEMNIQMLVIWGLIVGSMAPLNQNSVKKIMTYSSIYNLSMMLSSIKSWPIWLTFMIMYTLTTTVVTLIFKKMNFNFINQITSLNKSFSIKIEMFLAMISMAGMPPTLMFMMKLMILESLMIAGEYLIMLTVILTSSISMFFYMRISILSMTFNSITPKWFITTKSESNMKTIMILSLAFPTLMYFKSLL